MGIGGGLSACCSHRTSFITDVSDDWYIHGCSACLRAPHMKRKTGPRGFCSIKGGARVSALVGTFVSSSRGPARYLDQQGIDQTV